MEKLSINLMHFFHDLLIMAVRAIQVLRNAISGIHSSAAQRYEAAWSNVISITSRKQFLIG